MNKCKILVPKGCRSDYPGLAAPIVRRLEKEGWCEVNTFKLYPADFYKSYGVIDTLCKVEPIDLMLCVADRVEMCAAACAAFHNNVAIGHVYAGITNVPLSTLDDINRHCITLWSDLAFCESVKACEVVDFLWKSIYKPVHDNIFNCGITHLDDLEIDESLVPDEPYDLIVYNPTTTNKELIGEEITEIHNHLLPDRRIIWIEPNPDLQYSDYPPNFHTLIKESTKPRPQYLGLLKNCKRFISNSSDVYYMAPQWLSEEQIIQIGSRNKNRSTPKKLETGASDKIVKILEKWWLEKDGDK